MSRRDKAADGGIGEQAQTALAACLAHLAERAPDAGPETLHEAAVVLLLRLLARAHLGPRAEDALPKMPLVRRLEPDETRLAGLVGTAPLGADPARGLATAYEAVLDLGPLRGPEDGFTLQPVPFARRGRGGYYTPPELVDAVLARALDPLLPGRPTAEDVLRLRVCDPACGAGGFLVSAVDRLAAALGRSEDTGLKRAIAERVVHGVDKDPLAATCARLALALHVTPAGEVPPDLTATIRCGDALFGELHGPGPTRKLDRAHAQRWLGSDAGAAKLDALAARERLFHWPLSFPEAWQRAGPGFDAVVGNPPWERVKLHEVEWFAARAPSVARAPSAAARGRRIAALKRAGDPLWRAFAAERARRQALARAVRDGGDYPLLGGGDVNLYALFVERAMALLAPAGMAGLLVPSGIAADRGAGAFLRAVLGGRRLAALIDFENRRTKGRFFPGVDGRFKFAVVALTGGARRVARTELAFALREPDEIDAPGRRIRLSPDALARFNPESGGLPVLRSREEAALAARLYARWPLLAERRNGALRLIFPVRYRRMLDMTNDAHLFRPAGPSREAGTLPLYEGKMVQAFDHRAAAVGVRAGNLKRPGQPRPATAAEHADPEWRPQPRFRVAETDVDWPAGLDWAIGLKHVTSPTNARTVIAAVVPRCAAGNSLPLLLPEADDAAGLAAYRRWAPLLLANLNALVFDWLARQKVHGQNLNLYILQQLPVLPPPAYAASFGGETAEALVRREVVTLSHTADDLAAFARDQGCAGPPATWDDADRARRRARLDALYLRLYGVEDRQVDSVLAGFAALERGERRAHGHFLTAELIRAALSELPAPDCAPAA